MDEEEDYLTDPEFLCLTTGLSSLLFLVSLLPKTDIVCEMECIIYNCFNILKYSHDDVEKEFSDRQLDDLIKRHLDLIHWVESRISETEKKNKKPKRKKKG